MVTTTTIFNVDNDSGIAIRSVHVRFAVYRHGIRRSKRKQMDSIGCTTHPGHTSYLLWSRWLSHSLSGARSLATSPVNVCKHFTDCSLPLPGCLSFPFRAGFFCGAEAAAGAAGAGRSAARWRQSWRCRFNSLNYPATLGMHKVYLAK